MTIAELKFYIHKLSVIPDLLDSGPGEARCREIGEKIYFKYGKETMLYVLEHYRDKIDRTKYTFIQRIWFDYSGGIIR
jgi:hypothetical protein